MGDIERRCWICNRQELRLIRQSRAPGELSPDDFAITNRQYGRTAAIFQCLNCRFRFCPDIGQVLSFYEELEDIDYEQSRPQRIIQARRLLGKVHEFKSAGRLFDIGAGDGTLINQAMNMGYSASGIEPSRWLWEKAVETRAPALLGTLPRPEVGEDFDIVTMIDVIEHVQDPVGLLQEASRILADDGVIVIVTPNVNSIAARVMGARWWHYRVAHIGYFDRATLLLALANANLRLISVSRPGWYLSTSYILERLSSYFPVPIPGGLRKRMSNIILPVNFLDSLMFVAVKS